MNPAPLHDFGPLFNSLPGLYLVLLPDLTIIAVSDAYLDATMTEREVILGRGLFEVFPDNPADREASGVLNLRASLNAVKQYEQPHKMAIQKYDIRRPDGTFTERYWNPLNTPVFNERNELVYIIHNVVDVTCSHEAEINLKKNERDYQLLVNCVKDYAIFMVDTNGRVASWNSGAESIKGYTAEEIIGRPIDIFYSSKDKMQEVPKHNLEMALQYGHFETEGLRLRKDGTTFWANIVFTALKDEAGLLYGYSKITRDITERKNAQEQLESLSRQINQSNDAIFTTDNHRIIKSWNKGAQNLYGFTEAEVLGKDIKEILSTSPQRETEVAIIKSIAECGYWSGEIKRKTKAGTEIPVRSSISAIKDNNGEITGFVGVSFDTSLQKHLGEQVNHLANIVDQSSEAIISRGLDQRLLSWNKGAEVLFGYKKEQVIGKTPKEIGMVEFSDEEIKDIEQEIIKKGSWKAETKYYHKNGSSFFGEVTGNAVKNEQGELTSMVFIINDISLRRQLEGQLRDYNEKLEKDIKERTAEITKNENRFRALIENNHDIISLVDASFQMIYRSPSAERITGWSNEEMMGEDGTKHTHPDDREKASQTIKEVLENPGRPVKCLIRNKHKNGHYLWLEGALINLLNDEAVKAIVFNFRDVTGRIESEEKLANSEKLFRALIENNNDIITLMDESFNLTYRSPSAVRVTGWTNEDMLGKDATKNIHVDDRSYAAAIVKEVMENRGKMIETKFRMQHKDGHYIWVEGALTNLLQDPFVKAVVFNYRNITRRVHAEEKLIASEKQFRHTLDNMLEGIQIIDFDWRFMYVNDAFVKYGTHTRQELIGHTIMKNFPGIERTGLFKAMQRCMTERVTEQLETEFVFPDKTRAYYQLSIQPVPEGIFILSLDITERKKQAEALLQSQKRLNQSQEIVHIGNWEVNFESNTSRWSDEAYRIYGLTPGSLGLSIKEWMSFVHPDDIDYVKKEIENSQTTFKDFSLYHRIVRKDGVIRHVYSLSKYEFDAEGKPVGIYGIVHDVTETKKAGEALRQSEIRLNEAQAIAHISNWEIDLSENVHNWSDEFYRIFGLNKHEVQPSAEFFLSLIHPDDLDFARKKVEEAFIISKDSSFNFRFIRSDKVTRHGYSEWKFEFDKKGNPLRLYGIVQDITERKEAEENLISLQKEMLARKIQEQKKIARTIIKTQEKERNHIGQELHDNITQMLAGIKLYLGIAANKNESAKTLITYPLELIDKTIEEIRLLCRQLVTPVTNVDLEELIVVLIKILEQTAIKTEFIYSVPKETLSDDLQLNIYRIIQELVNNIQKYAGARNVKIAVNPNKKNIDIIVTDDGKGFDPKEKRKGIGISNMINRVKSFNGEIKIESSEGNGCKTSITVPY